MFAKLTWLHWLGIGLNAAVLVGIILEFKAMLRKDR